MAQAVAVSSDPLPADVVFLQQPQNLTVAVGGEAVFTVQALSVGVRDFQWKHQGQNLTNNETVHGAQTPRLVISSVSAADAGDYQVLVGAKFLTIAFLSASNSATAHLTVGTVTNSPPWFGQVQLREDHFLQLEIHGLPGTAYRLDVSSNLTDWTPLFTTNAPAGVFDLFDGPISGQNRRYYRLAVP